MTEASTRCEPESWSLERPTQDGALLCLLQEKAIKSTVPLLHSSPFVDQSYDRTKWSDAKRKNHDVFLYFKNSLKDC